MATHISKLLTVFVTLAIAGATASAFVFFETESGEPLRWKADHMTVRVATVEPDELALADIAPTLTKSLATWFATGCVPDVTIIGTVDAVQGSLPPSTKGPADNIIVFIETAAHWSQRGHGTKEIAVTIVANNPKTGEIVDADIEVNDAGFDLTVSDASLPGQVDLQSTLTHEVGHFYGLDHSPGRETVMFPDFDPANPRAKRSLSQDDIDGICALYAIPFPPAEDDCAGGGATAPLALAGAILALAWRSRRANHETSRPDRA